MKIIIPFDPDRGGGGANLVGTDYLFSPQARSENLLPGKSKTGYLFSTTTNIVFFIVHFTIIIYKIVIF